MQTSQLDGNAEGSSQQPIAKIELPETLPTRPTRLLLICHAESMQRRYGNLALTDTGLTALGWEQSSALAEWLRSHEQVDHLISSTQLRCRLTAQRISQALDLPVVLASQLPPSPRRNWILQVPTGDSPEQQAEQAEYQTYQARVVAGFNHLLANRWGQTSIVVLNPNAIVALLRHLCGGSIGIAVEDSGISEVTLLDRQWQLVYLNRREHMPHASLNSPTIPADPQVNGDLWEQVALARQVYNNLASTLSVDDLAERATALGEPDQELIRFANVEEGQRLLEVGSGLGLTALALARSGASEVVGVDISPTMLERAEYLRLSSGDAEVLRRVSYRLGPAHALPIPANSFDTLLCRMLLHHIPKLERTLAEFHRVLKPGGSLVLVEIAGSDDPVKRATQNVIESKRNPSHATIRTVDQIREKLAAAGFAVDKERIVKQERRVQAWLNALALDKQTRQAVVEMLEASIETDAAELHVHTQNDELVFEQRILYLHARKIESAL